MQLNNNNMKNSDLSDECYNPTFMGNCNKKSTSQGKMTSSSVTKKVLVIDYNAAILDIMKIIITDSGYTFLSTSAFPIPEKISAMQPDLILIEDLLCNLPQGRKVSQSLKRSALTSSIPIVMMTTAMEPVNLISESGADTLLIKPFDIHKLEEVLHLCS